MDQQELKAIQARNVDDAAKAIDGMESAEDLAALRALEEADGTPRKTVIEAIEKRVAELAAGATEPPAPPASSAPKAPAPAPAKPATAAAPAPWKARDYSGPLTGDQAAWRNANIKPVVEVRKK